MELMNISSVSKQLNISSRTLRYYEEIGLIKSMRVEGYSYRMYDEETLVKIKQIILLKSLNIKLKDIQLILNNQDAMVAIDIFQKEINSIDESVKKLSAARNLLELLIDKLRENSYMVSTAKLLNDKDIADIILPLCLNRAKENINMTNVKKNFDTKNPLGEIRIIHIPPCYVAASNNYGIQPEGKAQQMMKQFAKDNNLTEVKPDTRIFGFNNPNPTEGKKEYGYEFWITIPEDMDVVAPLEKKYFAGGLYAAYCIKMGDFHKWAEFTKWVEDSKEYEYERREPFGMFGSLEEQLNAYSFIKEENIDTMSIQLDLLIPVKKV